jgi:hypothetical protein
VRTALVIAGTCAASVWILVKVVFGHMLQEEAATRLSRIPFALIRLATARLPRELRDDMAAEWRAELNFLLHSTEGMPLTRLLRGIRYSLGMVKSAPAIADNLRGSARRLLRTARYLASLTAIGFAVWCVTLSYQYLHPGAQVFSFIIFGPTPHQLILTGISYLCTAAALLGTAVLLATGKWPIANFNLAGFIAAEILSYLASGALSSLIVAGAIFCILGLTVWLQLKTHRRAPLATWT